MKSPRNIPASVRQRLLNRAKSDRRPFNELLQYYAMERFLYRLSQSAHADRFIIKGALMLRVWRSPELRPTMDIDMLGKTSNEEADIVAQIRDILTVDVETDGLAFDPDSIQAERITEDADYEGIRIRFLGALGSARINMQIDIGFGDVVYPEPEEWDLPTMLNSPAPRLLCYSRESSIAEKLEAMVKLGMLNSRMKDFYDIWILSQTHFFKGQMLQEAFTATCRRRKTAIRSDAEIFSDEFSDRFDKQSQWSAFLSKGPVTDAPAEFSIVMRAFRDFLLPLACSNEKDRVWNAMWLPAGPWYEQGIR